MPGTGDPLPPNSPGASPGLEPSDSGSDDVILNASDATTFLAFLDSSKNKAGIALKAVPGSASHFKLEAREERKTREIKLLADSISAERAKGKPIGVEDAKRIKQIVEATAE